MVSAHVPRKCINETIDIYDRVSARGTGPYFSTIRTGPILGIGERRHSGDHMNLPQSAKFI